MQEPEAGITLANLLLSEIHSDRYTLYERGQLTALLEEARFQESDLVDSTSRAIQFGRLAGIRYLVIGELSSLGGTIRWTARVVDCQTGEIGERDGVRFNHFREIDRALAELLAGLELNSASLVVGTPRRDPVAPPAPAHPVPHPAPAPESGNSLVDAVNPDAAFAIALDTGENKRRYTEGESISFRVTSQQAGYVTLI